MDLFRPHIKGWVGEIKTQLSQKFFLDSKIYTSFNNFIVVDENVSTQIDHIIVSKYGVFVIETKDWSGWIYGYEKDKTWTQNMFGTKTRFQNPLHQNHRHKMSLANYLDIDVEKIIPIIMVWGNCEFKTRMPDNVILGGITGCTDYIKEYSDVVLTDKEVIDICEKLRSGKAEMNLLSGFRHIQSVKKRYESETICPKCGNSLVRRKSQRGPFLDCSNYPKCKYTKNISY